MKKSILMLAAGALLLATPSCKKGENDPALSLASRKARVSGEWNVTGWDYTSMNTESDGDYQSETATMSGNTITETESSYDKSDNITVTTTSTTTLNEGTFTFDKDGTFSRVWNTTKVSTSSQDFFGTTYTTTTTSVSTNSISGNWSFVGKVKDEYKKKERIVLNTTSSSYTAQSTAVTTNNSNSDVNTVNGDKTAGTDSYNSGEWVDVWEIDQLKGKEMILKSISKQSGSYSVTPFGGSTTSTTDDVYTSETKITLTAK